MFWPPVLDFVTSVWGVDRVLFAADYPFESTNDAVRFKDGAPISDSDKEKISSLYAGKFLNL